MIRRGSSSTMAYTMKNNGRCFGGDTIDTPRKKWIEQGTRWKIRCHAPFRTTGHRTPYARHEGGCSISAPGAHKHSSARHEKGGSHRGCDERGTPTFSEGLRLTRASVSASHSKLTSIFFVFVAGTTNISEAVHVSKVPNTKKVLRLQTHKGT